MSRSFESTSLTTRRRCDRAGVDLLEPGEHPQQRRLAAARRADQHHELAVGDVEAMPWMTFVCRSLLDVAERDRCHGAR
jgi:hypothetical protein